MSKNPLTMMFYIGLATGQFFERFKRKPRTISMNSQTYNDWGVEEIKPNMSNVEIKIDDGVDENNILVS